jgi:hypothetical protein
MVQGSAYKWARTLPRTLREGLDRFKTCQPVIELLGRAFLHGVPDDQGSRARQFRGRDFVLGTRPPVAQGLT